VVYARVGQYGVYMPGWVSTGCTCPGMAQEQWYIPGYGSRTVVYARVGILVGVQRWVSWWVYNGGYPTMVTSFSWVWTVKWLLSTRSGAWELSDRCV